MARNEARGVVRSGLALEIPMQPQENLPHALLQKSPGQPMPLLTHYKRPKEPPLDTWPCWTMFTECCFDQAHKGINTSSTVAGLIYT